MEPGRLTDEIDTALYRITQEALNNVAKHAQAEHVAILLDGRLDRVSLIVEDDGIGFDVQSVGPRQRFGVVGMRERATLLGGTLDIESRSGQGHDRCRPYSPAGESRAESAMRKLRILLAENHNVMREGLRMVVEREIPTWKWSAKPITACRRSR